MSDRRGPAIPVLDADYAALEWRALAEIFREEGVDIENVVHDEIVLSGPPEAIARVVERVNTLRLMHLWSKEARPVTANGVQIGWQLDAKVYPPHGLGT